MNWLKRLLGNRSGPGAAEAGPEDWVATWDEDVSAETMLAVTATAREACYASLGQLDPDVLAPLINPSLAGGPRWPALRQAWNVIYRRGSTLIASNGLSDPFGVDDAPPQALGYGVEVYAETRGAIDDIARSWLFDLVYQVSQNIADHGNFLSLLKRYEIMSMLLHVEGLPADWRNPDGSVSILIGLSAKDIPATFHTPYGPCQLAALTLLRPQELAFLEAGSDIPSGRRQLAELLSRLPSRHINDLQRPSVIPG